MLSISSKTKKIALALAVLAATLTGSVAVASPANATPGTCNAFVGTDGHGYGRCTSGTGEFRVATTCKGWINLGYGFTQYGGWSTPSSTYTSVAICPVGSWNWAPSGGNFQAWIEKR